MYGMSHVVLSYLPKMGYVLHIDVSSILMLFTQDELYGYMNETSQMFRSYFPEWAMCSISMDPISHGYLPMSYVYGTNELCAPYRYISWLFTQD